MLYPSINVITAWYYHYKISKRDYLLMARGDSSSTTNLEYDIITANCLKLGRNNLRSMARGGVFV